MPTVLEAAAGKTTSPHNTWGKHGANAGGVLVGSTANNKLPVPLLHAAALAKRGLNVDVKTQDGSFRVEGAAKIGLSRMQ